MESKFIRKASQTNNACLLSARHRPPMILRLHRFFNCRTSIKQVIFMTNPVAVFSKHCPVARTSKITSHLFLFKHRRVRFRLFEIVVRHLDLDSLLEFLEQLRSLTETSATKRISDISAVPHQNLFPMHVVIERIGDMTLGSNAHPSLNFLGHIILLHSQVLLLHFARAITFAESGAASHRYLFW
jgi:hypothetical protein